MRIIHQMEAQSMGRAMQRIARTGLLTAILSLVVGLVAVTPTLAQEPDAPASAEGIQVHGHWVIEVYEGDRLIEHREFENSLAAAADTMLSGVLAGDHSIDTWRIDLQWESGARSGSCEVSEFACTTNLSVTSPNSGESAGTLILSGSPETPSGGGTITDVQTSFSFVGDGGGRFTTKTLSQPETVQDGQTVKVTVILSFS